MTNVIKFSIFAGVIAIAFGLFAFLPALSNTVKDAVFAPIVAYAEYGDGGGGGGCGGCGGDYGGGDYGGGGNDYCNAYPSLCNPPQKPPASCDFFTASPKTLPHGGGNVTLTWETTNAKSVSINNGIGNVSKDGSMVVNINSNTTWTLTAVGSGGNDTCTAKVKVNPPEEAASCDFLNASKTSLPEGGGNVTLTWGTTNATSVSINNGVGTVSADGSTVVNVTDDITYTLTAQGTGGSDTCSVSIEVDEDEEEPKPRCDFFTISDSSVEEGDRVTLEWGTTNADQVSINQGIGNVSDDGSKNVTIDDDTTFILTVSNSEGEDTCRVSVEVDEDEDDEPKPRCELDISDDKVKKGTKVTLEWETSNADEIEIEDDKGKEIFESKKSKYMDGEIDVIINRDTEFTLIARGDGGKRECEVDVEVEDDVTVFEKRDQPLVISLTSVPYTGFEAGPALTFLFYALLTLWALFIAYILVIKKGSVMGLSLYGASHGSAVTVASETEEYKKKVQALVAKYAHRPWN